MAKPSCKMFGLKYPASDKIKNRTSTVARAMACSLTPRIPATDQDRNTICNILHINPESPTCAYCGRPATHLDHLHSLIDDVMPTGYLTEPANLVPCCEKCNQPKGSLEWEVYMITRMDLTNEDGKVQERIKYLHDLDRIMPAHRINFANMKGFDIFQKKYIELKDALASAQVEIDKFLSDNKEQINKETGDCYTK